MISYLIRRLALIPLTLLGIMATNFVLVQLAPGGPVELMISRIKGTATEATARIGSSGGDLAIRSASSAQTTPYRGAQGVDPAFIKQIEKQFGFDKPPLERFWLMLGNYARFDFGTSFYRDVKVVDLVVDHRERVE